MGKFKGQPKGAMRKAKASNATGARFNRCSTADPTRGVTGVLFTFNDCHTINAMREMTNWVMETVDILYPKTPEEEAIEASAAEDNKRLLAQFYADLASFKAQQAELKDRQSAATVDETIDSNVNASSGNAFDAFTTEADEEDLGLGEDAGMSLFGGSFTVTEATDNGSAVKETENEDNFEPQRKRARTTAATDADFAFSSAAIASTDMTTPIDAAGTLATESVKPTGLSRPRYPSLRPVSRVMELDLGLRGVGFLHVMLEGVDMVRVCRHMLETQMLKQGMVKTRYIMRILPIVSSCFASLESVEKLAETLVPKMFENVPKNATFSTHIDRRTKNDNIPRDDLQKTVGSYIPKGNNYRLDNKDPDYTLIVQVIGRVILLGIAPAFNKLGKYNVQTLASLVTSSSATAPPAPGETSTPLSASSKMASESSIVASSVESAAQTQ